MLGTDKLDRYLLVVQQIGSLEQDAERTLANLLSYAIMHTNNVGRRRGHGSGDRQEPACRLQAGDNEMDGGSWSNSRDASEQGREVKAESRLFGCGVDCGGEIERGGSVCFAPLHA